MQQLQARLHESGAAKQLGMGAATTTSAAGTGLPAPSPPAWLHATPLEVAAAADTSSSSSSRLQQTSPPLSAAPVGAAGSIPVAAGQPPGAVGLPPLSHFLPPALTGAHGGAGALPFPAHQQAPGASWAGPSPSPWQPPPQQHAASAPAAMAAVPVAGQAGVGSSDAEVYRTLLRHEAELARLRRHNRTLRAAVCKLDRRLPMCRAGGSGDDEFN